MNVSTESNFSNSREITAHQQADEFDKLDETAIHVNKCIDLDNYVQIN